MPNSVCIIAGHGLGDHLLAFQCGHFVKQAGYDLTMHVASRPEISEIIHHLFSDQFRIDIDEQGDRLTKDNLFLSWGAKMVHPPAKTYYIVPDLLNRNPFAFEYDKYNCHPQTVRSTRLLTHKWKPKKQIYTGLNTTTAGYQYDFRPTLLFALAESLPDYTIYCPIINKWAGIEIAKEDPSTFEECPANLVIAENPDFKASIDELIQSEYGIFLDNGPSHIAYHLGMPRLLLDPRMVGTKSWPWVARWRETIEDSVPLMSSPYSIARLVKTNIQIPQTTLLPRTDVLYHENEDWAKTLIFKY